MNALLDGDILAFRVACTVEDQDTFGIPRWRIDEMVNNILEDTKATEFQIFLSGSPEENFRYQIYPQYKESRKNKPKPKWLEDLKAHLVTEWNAQIACGMEADDYLGIHQCYPPQRVQVSHDTWEIHDSVICSIDKDLLQIPGNHYNFVKKEFQYVTEFEGLRSFYRQILTGDGGDDIPGLYNVGPVKSAKWLAACQTESDLLEVVMREYVKRLGPGTTEQDARNAIQRNGSLLKIRQSFEEGIWSCPFHLLKQTEVSKQLSTPSPQEANVQSTEPTSPEMESGSQLVGQQTEDSIPPSSPPLG